MITLVLALEKKSHFLLSSAISKDEGLLWCSHVSILRDSLFFHYLFYFVRTFPVLLSIAQW